MSYTFLNLISTVGYKNDTSESKKDLTEAKLVTYATEELVEETFEYEAYNDYLESTAYVKGEFGLILETPEVYNR